LEEQHSDKPAESLGKLNVEVDEQSPNLTHLGSIADKDQEHDYLVPEEVEDIIGVLLDALRDKVKIRLFFLPW